jgi:DNA-binding XRE family transcriptional regulator
MIHRHLDIPAGTSVEKMPLAAVHDLLERGDLDDWRPVLRQIENAPRGETAQAVARLVDAYPMYGTSPLLRAWIERCRNRRMSPDVGAEGVQRLAEIRRSLGLTQLEVARRMGMSQSDYSKLERRKDVRVSTLRAASAAIGGRLTLSLELPGRVVEIQLGERAPGDQR